MSDLASAEQRPSVLVIDDEPSLLAAVKRTLRSSFYIQLAESGDKALRLIEENGPVDVVVCDMNMPGKSGVDTLAEIAARSPDTIRIMLTGQADAQTAMRAVNEGRIFRFLAKPCSSKVLADAITAGVEQHKLVNAERELLDKTLSGSIKVLTDIIAIYDPQGFARKGEVRSAADAAAEALGDRDLAWKIEMAMLLGPIGRAALPGEICAKLNDGTPLSKNETDVYHASVEVAHKLIQHIPRLEDIAEAVRHQFKNFDGGGWPANDMRGSEIPELSRISRILSGAFDRQQQFQDVSDAMDDMRGQAGIFDLELLQRLEPVVIQILSDDDSDTVEMEVPPQELAPGDRLLTPIIDRNTREVLLANGSRISGVLVDRIRNLERLRRLNRVVRIRRHVSHPSVSEAA